MEKTGARLDRRLVIAGCIGLAALSLRLPWDLSYDPWGWLVWGQEITDPLLRFNTETYPSWKPLPVVFTTVYSLFDGWAPGLWLVTARLGALMGVVLAYRLAARLGGVVAGVAAAAGVVLLAGGLRYFAGGASEPLLMALVLGAVDRHLDGRRGQALMLVFAASLLRPECWPFLLGYALFYALGSWRRALMAAVLLALVPVLWFVPEWVGAGDPFTGARLAKMSKEAHQIQALRHPALAAARHGFTLVLLPVLAAAAFALLRALREKRALEVALGVAAFAWIAEMAVLTAIGYAGIPRFALPAAGLLCVLGGVGIAGLVDLAGPRRRALAIAVVALACVPFAYGRATGEARRAGGVATRAALEDQLPGLFRSLGGRDRVVACGLPTVDQPFRTSFAWHLAVPVTLLDEVHPPNIAFRTRRRLLTGFEGRIRLRPVRAGSNSRLLLRQGGWQVFANGRCARLKS
jgi:MFS family permease